MEYLNYQDQVHHDVTDGGYDQDHIPEQQHRPDDDDIDAAAAPAVLPLEPPFPGGPENISLLHSYAKHVALPLWYNSDNVSVIFNYFKLSYAIQINVLILFYMCVCLIIFFIFFLFKLLLFSLCLIMI